MAMAPIQLPKPATTHTVLNRQLPNREAPVTGPDGFLSLRSQGARQPELVAVRVGQRDVDVATEVQQGGPEGDQPFDLLGLVSFCRGDLESLPVPSRSRSQGRASP